MTYKEKKISLFAAAFKTKEIRNRILFTVFAAAVVRAGSQIPVPGLNTEYFAAWFESAFGDFSSVLSMFSGGSFESLSIFALGITPYITASIIMQLLTIAFPKLEEISKNGEQGRIFMGKVTRYAALGLALLSAFAMTVSLRSQGILESSSLPDAALCLFSMTAGSAALIFIGDEITERGIGNGISMILLINILSTMPSDFSGIFSQFVFSKSVFTGVVSAIAIILIAAVIILASIVIGDAERRIPIQSSRTGRMAGGIKSDLPIKVNTAGVIPVIFASSILAVPGIISGLAGYSGSGVWSEVLKYLSSSYWFNAAYPKYTAGLLLYVLLMIFFAYFYTQITFNPAEIAENLKKGGAFIPGIRPGSPTRDYLKGVLNSVIFIGAVMLSALVIFCFAVTGLSGASVSFGATSVIIVVTVILETRKQLQSMTESTVYKSILK